MPVGYNSSVRTNETGTFKDWHPRRVEIPGLGLKKIIISLPVETNYIVQSIYKSLKHFTSILQNPIGVFLGLCNQLIQVERVLHTAALAFSEAPHNSANCNHFKSVLKQVLQEPRQ